MLMLFDHLQHATLDVANIGKADIPHHEDTDPSQDQNTGSSNTHALLCLPIADNDSSSDRGTKVVLHLLDNAAVNGVKEILALLWKCALQSTRESVPPDSPGHGTTDGASN